MAMIMDLTIRAFQGAQKVTNGGLFMIHGLIITVEQRFMPYVRQIVDPYLLSAVKMECSD